MKISCLILTSDSNVDKGSCLKHCLLSVCKQEYCDYEIVVIDNSRKVGSSEIICKIINEVKQKILLNIPIRIVKPKTPLSRGAGRTFGGGFCTGDYMVFLDDDAVVLSEDAFSIIDKYSKKYDFGYGAKRYWTKPFLRFNENSDTIFEGMLKGEKVFNHHLGFAPKFIRGDIDNTLQNVSFIGHFGFCKSSLFNLIGGYPDFPGCDFEDDYFMYKCFQKSGKFIRLDNIKVVHITHSLNKSGCSNITHYFNLLKKEGIFWFHIRKTFKDSDVKYTNLIEILHSYHPDYRVIEGYKAYQNILRKQKKMPRSIVYSIQDYSILLDKLIKSTSLDDFVKGSSSDFDNLIPVISSFITTNLVSISKLGKIKDLMQFKRFPNYINEIDATIIPQSKFNQFPCDQESRYNRLELIKERYPLTDHLSVALLGDDDLVSILLGNQSRIDVTVVEVDKQITNIIKKSNLPNINIFNEDLRIQDTTIPNKVQTFMIDPPYTKNGILLFIYKGLQLIHLSSKEIHEFYVILNQSMTKNFMYKIQSILSGCGIWVHEVRPEFGYYVLPKEYSEYTRAMDFLDKNSISTEKLTYSSSSSLYIFRTIQPNLDMLRENIDMKMIYKHNSF